MLILFSIIGPYKGGIKTKTRNEQRKDNRPLYDEDFFISRVIQYDEKAEVTAQFIINHDKYTVTHSLSDGSLKKVIINGEELDGKPVTYKTYESKYSKVREKQGYDEEELKGYLIYKYQEKIKKSTELPGGINTLISMLLDVMFFDEGRKFTFWSADLQETIIGKYIVDKDFYEEYCEKKLDSKALESKYKKASETVNFMTKFLEKEKSESEPKNNDDENDLRIQLSKLDNDIQYDINELNWLKQEYHKKNESVLRLMREIEKIKEQIQELDEVWYKNLFPSQYTKYYTKFSKKMIENVCPICGQVHLFNIKTEDCIFCQTRLEIEESPDLVKLDIERRNQQILLASRNKEVEGARKTLAELKQKIFKFKSLIEKKISEKNQIEVSLNPSNSVLEQNDAKRLEKARHDRDMALLAYNKSKEEENNMKKEVESKLVNNFRDFKNVFITYAKSFFGSEHKINFYLPFMR